jgi:hypothetical protein
MRENAQPMAVKPERFAKKREQQIFSIDKIVVFS